MLLRKGIEVVITALTRNQVCGNASWVRIPLFPPKNSETRSVFPNFFSSIVGFERVGSRLVKQCLGSKENEPTKQPMKRLFATPA